MANKSKVNPCVSNFSDWKKILQDKHLLVDADFIISIVEYKAEIILKELEELKVVLCFIHPVQIELLKTKKQLDRLKRQALMQKMYKIPITKIEFENSLEIQEKLAMYNCYPSVADLYLAGVLERFKNSGMFLATSDLAGFPCPIFNRVSGIILQNEKSIKIASILSLADKTEKTVDNIPF